MAVTTSSFPEPLALWVTPVSDPGGVARHVLDTARAGIPGFRLAVLCPPGPLAEQLRGVGAAVLTGPFGPDALDAALQGGLSPTGSRSPRFDAELTGPGTTGLPTVPAPGHPVRAARRGTTTAHAAAASSAILRHAVRTLRPAVVHSHLAFADLVCAAVLRGLAPPGAVGRRRSGPVLVSTEHGIAGDAAVYHQGPVRARTMAALHSRRMRLTDVRIAVSWATARAMERRWGAEGVTVIPNGIDRWAMEKPPRVEGRGPRLLSLTRLAPEKNLNTLLDAVAELWRTHPDVRLTLAGDGPECERLRAAVLRRGLAESVRMPGVVKPREALAAHDVVVQLSLWENCSYTLLDAAAAGLGVVATDVGGNPEILPERCLVPPDERGMAHEVAARVARQLDPGQRPELPARWPTTAQMTRSIGEIYQKSIDRTETPA